MKKSMFMSAVFGVSALLASSLNAQPDELQQLAQELATLQAEVTILEAENDIENL